MSDVIVPGRGIIFMKVGTHAQERLQDIIARKTREIEEAGYALWGYGGNTCHPQTMVQPFARTYVEKGGVVYLCMHQMESMHFAEPIRADEFSADGEHWEEVPEAVNVLGSRYALRIRSLVADEFELPLRTTRVAIGNSRGRSGDQYIKGHVDKACLEIRDDDRSAGKGTASAIPISLVAELEAPYAVYLRNRHQ